MLPLTVTKPVTTREISKAIDPRDAKVRNRTADLGSLDVCNSQLELERLTRHRMTPRLPIRFFRWNDDLLLLVHLHPHQRLFETHDDLARPEGNLEGLVVAG